MYAVLWLFFSFYSVFKLGVTASAIGMVFIQYERCSHVKMLLLLLSMTRLRYC